ncbi:[FeFe] hydrogenase H-cluster maturation GTPase HydF [Adlercreutzia sp. ZJ138]|uniref:[FeFe] hydrogenase H-cluster maturation GTPase HydF n=1 Tax=Adlercreutzia sp. ZJ138 TaxID=2709405 RepID=UPI0013ECD172|nr:[FeFe] hydrogenase H-cluster maturation GTPase HydF [Adlercreutzia sp. ZJ138]
MGLNDTPASERATIGFFGICNAGKSSVVNAVTSQDLSIVSGTPGTTTDPVRKTMELLPLGPVVIVDAPGIDDAGELGQLRVRKAKQALATCDIAVLVIDTARGEEAADRELAQAVRERGIPLVRAWNKADLLSPSERQRMQRREGDVLVSAVTGEGINELKETIARSARTREKQKRLIADLIQEGDTVVLVVPIDSSAPKGRIILPQQMVLRDVLDSHTQALVCQPSQLAGALTSLRQPPRLVVTDSQAFEQVARIVPDDVPLTSFSILMARYRGDLSSFTDGARALAGLRDGDRVLVSEACTHHRQCEDIGTVKIPRMIRECTGSNPTFEFTSGAHFPDSLAGVSLVVHCGGCMISDAQMKARTDAARSEGVPLINYGMALAYMTGVLKRSLQPLPEAETLLADL